MILRHAALCTRWIFKLVYAHACKMTHDTNAFLYLNFVLVLVAIHVNRLFARPGDGRSLALFTQHW